MNRNWSYDRITIELETYDVDIFNPKQYDFISVYDLYQEPDTMLSACGGENVSLVIKDGEEIYGVFSILELSKCASRMVQTYICAHGRVRKSNGLCKCRIIIILNPEESDEEMIGLSSRDSNRHKIICSELTDLYIRKNSDYGCAFHKSYETYGMTMPCIRIGDKYNRLVELSKSKFPEVPDESIRDTLLDLANYAIMTVMEIDAQN